MGVIFHIFYQFSNAPPMLLTRISLAMAQIILQVLPQSPGILDELFALVPSIPVDSGYLNGLFTLLRVLPEELDVSLFPLERIERIRHMLASKSSTIWNLVYPFLTTQNGNDERSRLALLCLSGWPMDLSVQEHMSVMAVVFQCIEHYDVLLTDAVQYIMKVLPTCTQRRYRELKIYCMGRMVGLEGRYREVCSRDELDLVYALVLLFGSSAEYLGDVLLTTGGVELAFFLTRVCAYKEYKVVELAFNFWYDASDILLRSEGEGQQHNEEEYIPAFTQLVTVLRDQCVRPVEYQEQSEERRTLFTHFRSEVCDTISYVYAFLGDLCHLKLIQLMKQSLKSGRYEDTEATLYCFLGTCEALEEQEGKCVPQILALFPALSQDIHTQRTMVRVLGELAAWISLHPQYLPPALHVIQGALTNPNLIMEASSALKSLALYDIQILHAHVIPLLNVITPLVQSFDLDYRVRASLMVVGAQVVYLLGGDSESQVSFESLVSPSVHRVRQLLQVPLNVTNRTLLLNELQILGDACMLLQPPTNEPNPPSSSSLQRVPPLLSSFQHLYPLLPLCVLHVQYDYTMVSAVCRILKHALGNLNRNYFAPFLTPMLEFMYRMYVQVPHEDLLKVFSISLAVFRTVDGELNGNEGAPEEHWVTSLFGEALGQFMTLTFNRILKHGSHTPLILKHFFEFLSQALRFSPHSLLTTEVRTGEILDVTLQAARRIDYRLSSIALLGFIQNVLNCHIPFVQVAIHSRMDAITEFLIYGLCTNDVSRLLIANYIHVLAFVRRVYPNRLKVSLLQSQHNTGDRFPAPYASELYTTFIKCFFTWPDSEFPVHCETFGLMCRDLNLKYAPVDMTPFF